MLSGREQQKADAWKWQAGCVPAPEALHTAQDSSFPVGALQLMREVLREALSAAVAKALGSLSYHPTGMVIRHLHNLFLVHIAPSINSGSLWGTMRCSPSTSTPAFLSC